MGVVFSIKYLNYKRIQFVTFNFEYKTLLTRFFKPVNNLKPNFDIPDVSLQPASSVSEQILIFESGKILNRKFKKFLSQNGAALVADTDDTRGASNWVLGKLDRFFFIISIKTYLMMCSLSHKYKLQMQPKLNLF